MCRGKTLLIMALTLVMVCALTGEGALARSNCAYFDKNGDHEWQQVDTRFVTCTEDGYYVIECRCCGKRKKVITEKAYGHSWEKTGEMKPTCDKGGYAYYQCSECGCEDTKILEPLGHDWKDEFVLEIPTCTQKGCMRTKCKRCGGWGWRDIPKSDHRYGEWRVTTASTDSSKGIRTRICRDCGKEQTEDFYPEGTLRRGGSNDKSDVMEIQKKLADMGYLSGAVDGIFGKGTLGAVKAFQSAADINADGIAWPETIRLIRQAFRKQSAPPADAKDNAGSVPPPPEEAEDSRTVNGYMRIMENTPDRFSVAIDEVAVLHYLDDAKLLQAYGLTKADFRTSDYRYIVLEQPEIIIEADKRGELKFEIVDYSASILPHEVSLEDFAINLAMKGSWNEGRGILVSVQCHGNQADSFSEIYQDSIYKEMLAAQDALDK